MTDYTNFSLSGIGQEDIEKIGQVYKEVQTKLQERIVGLEEAIEHMLIAIFSGNHSLLVGVPGLAKTLIIRCIGDLLDLNFSRIQFTPDLMPSDITGSEILVQDPENLSREFSFLKGPIFANLLLADEINRTPPKTQAALLEAMEENTVTSTGRRFVLDPPFFVLATQNPIEQEGTYPLPAAQLDRFMFNILFDYPSREEEQRIMRISISKKLTPFHPLLSQKDILKYMQLAKKIYISEEIVQYALKICRLSRPQNTDSFPFVKENLSWGASPRAAQCLINGAKTRALLKGRSFATASDIRAIVHPVFRHRIILNYKAEADNVTPDEIVDQLVESIPSPDGYFHAPKKRKYAQNLYLSMLNR